jgi:hypothetical protein
MAVVRIEDPLPAHGALLACQGISAALALRTLNLYYLSHLMVNRPVFDMATRKSQRSRKATVTFKDRSTASAASAPKLTFKTARNNSKTALKPVAVEPLPELDHGPLSELPDYRLLFDLRSIVSKSTAIGLSEL